MLSIPNLITYSLPYGHFITRILKFFKVPINEPSCKPSKSIGDEAVYALGFEWKNRTWVKFTDNKFTFLAPSDDRPLNAIVLVNQLPDFSLTDFEQHILVEHQRISQQHQQLIDGQCLLFEHFGIPYPYPPPSPPSSPPQ